MKKLLNLRALLMLLIMTLATNVWGEDQNPDYVLDATDVVNKGSDNGYATSEDITVNNITWNVTGNSTMNPWRIGGKNLTGVDRAVYSKTAYSTSVEKITLEIGAATSVTINSIKLIHSTSSDFSNSTTINASGTSASTTYTFQPVGGFPKDSYFKFVFNVTIGSSNKFIEFKKVEFYNATSAPDDTRAAVNMTGFSATTSTLIKGGTTNTTVTNDQNVWTPSYTYESSNTNVATVSNDGVITAVAKGTAKITASLNIANDDATWKKGANDSKTIDIIVNNPSHNYTFYSNGTEVSSGSCEEGSAITFPANPQVADVVFMGWTESTITGTTDTAPAFVTSATMGTDDVTYYAVFATKTGSGEITYTKLTSNSFESGADYVLAAEESSNNSTLHYFSSYNGTTANESWGVTSTDVDDAIIFTLSGTADALVAQDASGNYIQALATGKFRMSSSSTTLNLKEDGTIYNPEKNSQYNLRYNHNNGSGGFRWYAGTTGTSAYFYKKEGGYTYSDYCTTVSAKATATLVIADEDKNISLNYGGTKNVTISVSEQDYDGTLTVTSSDEKVATVTYTGTTATINYVGEGEAYISVTAPSTANYYAINVPQAIKVATTDDRQVAEVTIDPATISVDNGASAEFTVTTAYDGTITAVSDKPAVAIVTYADGKVTVEGKSVGTATLTISGEGNSNYKPFSKTFNITVNKVVPVGIKNLRTQITSTDRNSQSNYEVKLVDAVVTYVSETTGTATPTIYLEDAEAGIAIYAKNTNLAVGDKLNGVISGKGYVYNGLTELTSITGFEKATGAEVPCTEVTLAQLAEDGMDAWESRRVVVKNLKINSEMSNRNATVEQNETSFTIREGVSGCTGEKLSSTDNGIASVVGYFQDYNSTTQLNVWSEDDIVLTEKADAQVVFNVEEGAGTSETPLAYTIGEDNTFPTAIVKDSEGNVIEGATVTYSTTNTAYISVDAETGVVTLKKYASKSNNVHVTATFAGNAEYKSAIADYYLTIAKGQPVINFSEPTVSVALDGTAGQAATVDTEKYGNLAVTYTSSNPEVASFADANNAILTLNAEGTTTISAKTVSNDAWNQSDKVSYTLTVTAPAAGYAFVTLNACGNDVEGGATELKVVKGRTVTLPVATTIKDEYTFRGWTATGEVAKTSTAPALVDENYVVNEDVTLYPVFSFEESDGEDDYDVAWVAVESSEIQTSGYDVVIVSTGAKSRCIKTTAGNAYLVGADVTIEDGKITSNITDDSKWWAYASGTGIAFSSASGNYLNANTVTYSEDQWTITPNGDKTYSMKSKKDNTYLYLSGNAWATTSDASLSKMQFFMEKLIPTTSSTTYYVSTTMNVLTLDENATEIEEIYDEYDKVVVKRSIKANTWSTLCLPFAMNADQIAANFGEDAEVKILTGLTVNGDSYTMNFSDCDEIDCALPCMIRVSNPVSEITVEGNVEVDTTEDPEDSAENGDDLVTFVGNYAKITVPTNGDGENYIISGNKFYFVNSEVTSKGFRGYFNLFSLSGAAKTLTMSFDDDTTGITSVETTSGNDKVYNLQGVRVDNSYKGIVIENGKKYIRK